MNNRDRDAQTVAYLLEAGWSRKQIAEFLHIPQKRRDKLSRLIKHAQNRDWLSEHFRYSPPCGENRDEIERRVQSDSREFVWSLWRLADLSGVRRVIDVFVLPSAVDQSDSLRDFGLQAAACLKPLLEARIQNVGVAWGSNLASAVRGLRLLYPAEHSRKPPITFFTVRGEPQCSPPRPHSAALLAAELHETVNAGVGSIWTLTGVPAMLPIAYRKQDAQVIRSYFEGIKTYDTIAVGPKCLLAKAGVVLSSVGPADPTSDLSRECIETGGLKAAQLVARTWGDLAGVHIAKAPRDSIVDGWNKAWLGLQESHLESVARRAVKGRGLGVVVVAASARKSRIIYECVRRGLISRLIIDRSLASGLKELLLAIPPEDLAARS